MIECVKLLGKFFFDMRTLEDAIEENKKKGANITATKLKTFCATRWVEKHQVLEEVHQLNEPIVVTLQQVVTRGVRQWNPRLWLKPMS